MIVYFQFPTNHCCCCSNLIDLAWPTTRSVGMCVRLQQQPNAKRWRSFGAIDWVEFIHHRACRLPGKPYVVRQSVSFGGKFEPEQQSAFSCWTRALRYLLGEIDPDKVSSVWRQAKKIQQQRFAPFGFHYQPRGRSFSYRGSLLRARSCPRPLKVTCLINIWRTFLFRIQCKISVSHEAYPCQVTILFCKLWYSGGRKSFDDIMLVLCSCST